MREGILPLCKWNTAGTYCNQLVEEQKKGCFRKAKVIEMVLCLPFLIAKIRDNDIFTIGLW